MNKEVKELIEQINRRWNYLKPPYMSLKKEEIDLFINYITQLETNWNELKKNLERTKIVCCDIGGTRWNTYNKVLTYMEELENNVERLDKVGG